jgi:hypothetical protein
MVKLGTFCEECCFYNPDKRTCKHGMFDRFKNAGAEVLNLKKNSEEHVKIDRVCVFRREPEWLEENKDKDISELLKNETYIKGSIMILCENVDHLEVCLSKIVTMPNVQNFKIVIVHSKTVASQEVRRISDAILVNLNYTCIKLFDEAIDQYAFNEAFKRANNGFCFMINASFDFDVNMIEKLNYIINKKLERVIYVEPKMGEYHQSCCLAIMFKHLKGFKFDSLKNKIITYTEETSEDAELKTFITDWETINEKCPDNLH